MIVSSRLDSRRSIDRFRAVLVFGSGRKPVGLRAGPISLGDLHGLLFFPSRVSRAPLGAGGDCGIALADFGGAGPPISADRSFILRDTNPARRRRHSHWIRGQHLGSLMSEIGKRSADLGVPLGYHNHMGSMGERPEEVDRVLDAADPRYVKLELDIAHYYQGGGDPVKAIERYKDRLLFLHIKDV